MGRRLPAVLRQRDFGLLWIGLVAMSLASQMIAVAVGWQVYEIHKHPLDLGLVGLAEFVPLPLLALPGGQLADRLPRRLVFAGSIAATVVIAALLLVVTLNGARALWPFLALAAASGAASALGTPAGRALPPELVAPDLLASALAIRSTGMQAAVVAGPAVGGVLFSVRPWFVYAVAVGLLCVAAGCTAAIRRGAALAALVGDATPGWVGLLDGVRFLLRSRIVLGAIVLDLFAVLFGGAIALAPVFARTILHVGPVGLGVLRSAPAAGAVVAGVLLARRPLGRRAGRTLLFVVAAFGGCMVVFGLSRWFAVSAVALAVSGFVDMISMNVRHTTVALATPDELRGRVNAVEMVFISASNELGAFESGVAASLLGTVRAVVAGGIATIAIAGIWARVFPSLAGLDRLESVRPELSAARP
jgi:MFS family permease